MTVNWYARALDVLAQDCNGHDSDEIVLEIAKRNPSVLVRAVEAIGQRARGESEPWRKEFSELVRQKQTIEIAFAAGSYDAPPQQWAEKPRAIVEWEGEE